jgi:hypothetical protein
VLGLPTGQRISINSLEAAAKKQCSLSWHAVKAQLAKQAGSSKLQDDPYLLKVSTILHVIWFCVRCYLWLRHGAFLSTQLSWVVMGLCVTTRQAEQPSGDMW